jgi:hypothetical protein
MPVSQLAYRARPTQFIIHKLPPAKSMKLKCLLTLTRQLKKGQMKQSAASWQSFQLQLEVIVLSVLLASSSE